MSKIDKVKKDMDSNIYSLQLERETVSIYLSLTFLDLELARKNGQEQAEDWGQHKAQKKSGGGAPDY